MSIILSAGDEALLKRTLRFEDPHSLSPTLSIRPDDWQSGEIIGSYEHAEIGPGGTRRNGMKCIFGHPHMKGYILRPESGQLFCVGNKCGKTHFGADWAVESGNFDALQKRQTDLTRLLAWAPELAMVKGVLEGFWGMGRLRDAHHRANKFRKFFAVLLSDVEPDGGLMVEREEEDFNATQRLKQRIEDKIEAVEKKREEGSVPDHVAETEIALLRQEARSVKPVTRMVKVASGRALQGYRDFLRAEDAAYELLETITAATKIEARLLAARDTGSFSDNQLSLLVREIRRVALALDDYATMVTGLNLFLSQATIATLKAWSTGRPDVPEIQGTAKTGYLLSDGRAKEPYILPDPLSDKPCDELSALKERVAAMSKVFGGGSVPH